MTERNILQVFLDHARELGKNPCFVHKEEGLWKSVSWEEAEGRVRRIAAGLQRLGVTRGDRVAIFSSTRYEWTLADLAILSLGAITVPIYQSNTSEQARFILEDAGVRFVFAENETLHDLIRAQTGVEVVLFSGRGGRTLKEIEEGPEQPDRWNRGIQGIKASDVATYVYTSGTTGNPKGAILTHGNLMGGVEACRRLFEIPVGATSLLLLPLAHILGREMQFFQIYRGFVHAYAEGIEKIGDNIREVRPYFFVGVPRIFEKVYERILSQVEGGPPTKKKIFEWAVGVGRQVSRRLQRGQPLSFGLRLKRRMATVLVFGKLHRRLGGNLAFAISGGAPLSPEIAEFFHAAGILLLEGYGLTETFAAINCNTPTAFKFGTVGRPVFGTEEKSAADGEILVRGPMVFQGYYHHPEASRESFTADGWFKTGDIGEIDENGFLRITDRKKDIIVTAGGKNISPQNIENLLKTVPFISQVMVHGDRQKYLAALITLNRDQIEERARGEGLDCHDYRVLIRHPRIRSWVEKAIEEKNRQLASFETIKRFAILEEDFSQEAGELTPTLKVRRKFVSEKYKDVLAQLYQQPQPSNENAA